MVNLFFQIFSEWFCSKYDLTLDELLGHLSKRFSGDSHRFIQINLLIDHPLQRNAEKLLAAFIASHAMTAQKKQVHSTSHPTRTTDWPRTHVEHLTGNRGRYWNMTKLSVPDIGLRKGLVNLINRWINLLNLYPNADRKERERALEVALGKLAVSPSPWTLGMTKQLSRLDKTVGDAVSACLHHWERPSMRGKQLGTHLKNLFSREVGPLSPTNEDHLFEWITAMRIARAACDKGWKLEMTRNHSDMAKYGDFLLSKDGLRLRISKGKPRDGNGQLMKSANGRDAMLDKVARIAVRHRVNATGFEPDIVLTFYHASHPGRKTVTFLADAKNNWSGDGKPYIRSQISKAIAYVFAYSEILECTPKCTLFFRQGDISGHDLNTILNEMRKNPTEIDDVLCIGGAIDDPATQQEDAKAWFALIEERAAARLAPGRHGACLSHS